MKMFPKTEKKEKKKEKVLNYEEVWNVRVKQMEGGVGVNTADASVWCCHLNIRCPVKQHQNQSDERRAKK